MPPNAPSIIDYTDSYVQAIERPLVAWATFFLILEVIQWIFLRKASTKALSNRTPALSTPLIGQGWVKISDGCAPNGRLSVDG
eukprot:Skav212092  [mRNA]  locus=scaffold4509:63759:64620:+ [translate_table: standard]